MTGAVLARAVHVVAIILWIGGVGMVTTVLLPAIRAGYPPAERFAAFHALERRFARQARVSVALAGASGLWMSWRLDLWDTYTAPGFWWMRAMVAVWLMFAAMLFVAEPLFLDRFLARRAAVAPERTFRSVEVLHWVLLAASLITAAGATAGAHGLDLLPW